MRSDGRKATELRPIKISTDFVRHADGSVLIEIGQTRVICTASVEEQVPPFLRETSRGWVTAEYGMLPGCSTTRIPREAARGRVGGRTHEIQRLIGRSLRAVTNLDLLGSRTIWIDCDVIQADGGTRTASITGAFVALVAACRKGMALGLFTGMPVTDYLAAVSVGKVGDQLLLDLTYAEDSKADVDMNVVMTGSGGLIEVQGTAERAPFSQTDLAALTRLAKAGITQLIAAQKAVLGPKLAG